MSRTGRSWATPVGNLASPYRVLVDAGGRVLVGGWSLGWWVGADDRWHLPDREPALRQWLVRSAPVVETLLRIPSGDAVQRVYAARDAGPHGGEHVVVEVENRSPVPVALAWVVTSEDPSVGEIDLRECTVTVDDEAVLFFDRQPARVATSVDADGLIEAVTSGAAGREWEGRARPGSAGGGAAFVFPLPHTARLRAVLPLTTESAPGSLPGPTAVAKGWEAHGDRGARLVVPGHRLDAGVAAARRSLLLARTGTGRVWGEQPGAWAETAGILRAWDRFGFHEESAEVLGTLTEALGRRGYLGGSTGRRDANGAALVALDDHLRLSGLAPDRSVTEVVAAASLWIHDQDPRSFDPAEARWSWRGLVAAEDLFDLAGEHRAASDARADRSRLEEARGDLASGDGAGTGGEELWERIGGLLDSASPTWTWAGDEVVPYGAAPPARRADLPRHGPPAQGGPPAARGRVGRVTSLAVPCRTRRCPGVGDLPSLAWRVGCRQPGGARGADRRRRPLLCCALARRPAGPSLETRDDRRVGSRPVAGSRVGSGVADRRAPGRGAAGSVRRRRGRGVTVSETRTDDEFWQEVLRDQGASEEEIARARDEGPLELVALERYILTDTPVHDIAAASELSGVPPEKLRAFWRALGFPDPEPGEPTFGATDLSVLRTVVESIGSGVLDERIALQMARVIGSSLARIATAQVEAATEIREAHLGKDVADLEPASEAREIERTVGMLPMLSELMEAVWRRHIAVAARRRLMHEDDGHEREVTVGFADLEGFTSLSQQLPEDELAAVVNSFEHIAYDVVATHGGRVVKMIGDEVMFVADDTRTGAELALALADAYAAEQVLGDVRVGLATGPALKLEGDLYGPAVNLASRIVSIAYPGTVVVPREVKDHLEEGEGEGEFTFNQLRPHYLRHIGRVRLWVMRRAGDAEEPGSTLRRAREHRAAAPRVDRRPHGRPDRGLRGRDGRGDDRARGEAAHRGSHAARGRRRRARLITRRGGRSRSRGGRAGTIRRRSHPAAPAGPRAAPGARRSRRSPARRWG